MSGRSSKPKPSHGSKTVAPPSDPFAWCRPYLNKSKRTTFNPIRSDEDAAVYAELCTRARPSDAPLPIPPADVMAFWRFALRCCHWRQKSYHPCNRPTNALGFLSYLKETEAVKKIIDPYGERAHPILMALWLWWEYREEPVKSTRKRSTLSMRRRRGTPPQLIQIPVNIPGVEPLIAVPDADPTPKPPGRPPDWRREFIPTPLMAALLADLFHCASGERHRHWQTIEDLVYVSRQAQAEQPLPALRQAVTRLRRDPAVQARVQHLLDEWVLPAAHQLLHTGLLL